MKKFSLSVLAMFMCFAFAFAQEPEKSEPHNNWELGVNVGVANFAKIFSATETALNKGLGGWLNGIGLSASSYATAQCLIALRDTDLRKDLDKIKVPTLILHGLKDKICSFDLAGQMNTAIAGSQLVPFENSGHSLFLEETQKYNAELIKFAEK